MKRYANDPDYARCEREADLIAKGAVYHAVKLARAPDKKYADALDAWLMSPRRGK